MREENRACYHFPGIGHVALTVSELQRSICLVPRAPQSRMKAQVKDLGLHSILWLLA